MGVFLNQYKSPSGPNKSTPATNIYLQRFEQTTGVQKEEFNNEDQSGTRVFITHWKDRYLN